MAHKIHIPKRNPKVNQSGVIKINPEAVNALMKAAQGTNLSIRDVASQIIIQAVENNLITYDDAEDDE